MHPDLAALRILDAELEQLTGVDVGELFVGSVLGGVYRPSVFRDRQRRLFFGLTQVVVFLLFGVLAIPVGLLLTRNATQATAGTAAPFVWICVGIASLFMVSWHLYMRRLLTRFKTLMPLLDEVDRHHAVIQAVNLLDQLNDHVALPPDHPIRDRQNALEALQLTRTSLISGLQTERMLREHRGLLARQTEVMALIETNLANLRTLEVNHQATEYGRLLTEALHIGVAVYREIQQQPPE